MPQKLTNAANHQPHSLGWILNVSQHSTSLSPTRRAVRPEERSREEKPESLVHQRAVRSCLWRASLLHLADALFLRLRVPPLYPSFPPLPSFSPLSLNTVGNLDCAFSGNLHVFSLRSFLTVMEAHGGLRLDAEAAQPTSTCVARTCISQAVLWASGPLNKCKDGLSFGSSLSGQHTKYSWGAIFPGPIP